MVLAYSKWVQSEDCTEDHLLLHEERHRPVLEMGKSLNMEIPWKFCTAKGCFRCGARRGGFKFRWYSHMWEAEYLRLKKPNSWAPSDKIPQSMIIRNNKIAQIQIYIDNAKETEDHSYQLAHMTMKEYKAFLANRQWHGAYGIDCQGCLRFV